MQAPLHVLLVTVDTLRPDYLGINGQDLDTTPFLDELIASGSYFERAVSPMARTTPALASLMTGAYPQRTGVRRLTDVLGEKTRTLAELLHDRGYQTIAVVTNTLLVPQRRLDRGFDVYDFRNSVRTARRTTIDALARLEEVDPRKPVFAWVHYFDPHVPYHSDPSIIAAFDPHYEGPFRERFGHHPGDEGRFQEVLGYPPELGKRAATHRNALPAAVNAHIRKLYAADIRATDDALRTLIEGFRRVLGPRLVIVFTADHGESLGEHDFYYDHGDYAYNAGTRVPLAWILPVGHPDASVGRCEQWVSLVSVAPTLLELLGVEPQSGVPEQFEGRSLLPCLRGQPLDERAVFSESGHSWFIDEVARRKLNTVDGRFRSVIEGRWKLIWTPFQLGAEGWELYDVLDDPHETRNLYRPDHPEFGRLRELLMEWLARPGAATAELPVSDEDRERLRALGYVE